MKLPLKSLMAGWSPEPLFPFALSKGVALCPRSPLSSFFMRGTALLSLRIFPVITQPWWQNGPLKLKGYGVPHLRSKTTPFVRLRVWMHVCYKGNVWVQWYGFSSCLPYMWVTVFFFCGLFWVCVCVCVYVCVSMWWIMSLHNVGSY